MKKILLFLLLSITLNIRIHAQCAGVHFTPIAEYPVALGTNYGFSSFLIISGDFDNDGKQDLGFIGGTGGGTFYTAPYHILLQRNIRTGTLPSQGYFDTSVSVFSKNVTNMDFVVNDFNNDGKPDIAVIYGPYSGPDSLEILINNATTGNFSFIHMPIIPLVTTELFPTLKTGDFDHDGKQDLMYQGSDNKLYVILNTAYTSTSATFSSTLSYTNITFNGSFGYRSYAQGDMNSDTLPEVAFPGYNSDTMYVYKNISTIGSIKYKLIETYICPDKMSTGMFWDGNYVQIRDVNGDKKADISVLYNDASTYHQKLLFLKNVGVGSNVNATFSDTMELNHFANSKTYVIDTMGDTLPYASFSDFSFIYNDPCHLKPDILLSVEGASQKWSVISYLYNTSTLSKISYSAPCWFQHFTSDRAGVGDFNGDGRDDLLSMCDVCIAGSPDYGLSVLENVSTIKVNNQKIAFDTISIPCKANKIGGMKFKLYLPCHALANIINDSVTIKWKPNISTSDTATLMFGETYIVHVYNQSKKYDTTFSLVFYNPYSIGQNGVPIDVLFSDTTICPGTAIILSIAKSYKINHYRWSPNKTINNDTVPSPTVNPTTTTIYRVTSIGGQCLRDTFVTVNVRPFPVFKLDATDTIVCPGDTVVISTIDTNNILYNWVFINQIKDDSESHTLLNQNNSVMLKVDSTTNFLVSGYDGKCYGYNTITIYTISAPAVFAGNTWTLHLGESYKLHGTANNYNKFWWSPTIYMVDSLTLTPTVNPPAGMWYYLHAIDTATKCSSVDSVYINFDASGHIYVPTAFSPNGDGINDELKILKQNISLYHIRIYSRWGELVFESQNVNKNWDGIFNNQPMPVGTYVYIIQATDIVGHVMHVKGNVILVR